MERCLGLEFSSSFIWLLGCFCSTEKNCGCFFFLKKIVQKHKHTVYFCRVVFTTIITLLRMWSFALCLWMLPYEKWQQIICFGASSSMCKRWIRISYTGKIVSGNNNNSNHKYSSSCSSKNSEYLRKNKTKNEARRMATAYQHSLSQSIYPRAFSLWSRYIASIWVPILTVCMCVCASHFTPFVSIGMIQIYVYVQMIAYGQKCSVFCICKLIQYMFMIFFVFISYLSWKMLAICLCVFFRLWSLLLSSSLLLLYYYIVVFSHFSAYCMLAALLLGCTNTNYNLLLQFLSLFLLLRYYCCSDWSWRYL